MKIFFRFPPLSFSYSVSGGIELSVADFFAFYPFVHRQAEIENVVRAWLRGVAVAGNSKTQVFSFFAGFCSKTANFARAWPG